MIVVVIVGLVAAVAISLANLQSSALTAIITIAFALGLAVRYWWVIRILPWPSAVPRVTLLVAMWAAVVMVALNAGDPHAWAWSFVAVFWIGGVTEIYNFNTRQWAVGSAAFERSLRADHVNGARSTLFATVATAVMIVIARQYVPVFLAALVLVDWLRLAEMVRRHRRFLEASA